uniref:Uncharacterized protein n=1 Tax=Cercocebus atys TaxID=9531 RepID=A0A2K5N8I7_CERAT
MGSRAGIYTFSKEANFQRLMKQAAAGDRLCMRSSVAGGSGNVVKVVKILKERVFKENIDNLHCTYAIKRPYHCHLYNTCRNLKMGSKDGNNHLYLCSKTKCSPASDLQKHLENPVLSSPDQETKNKTQIQDLYLQVLLQHSKEFFSEGRRGGRQVSDCLYCFQNTDDPGTTWV